MLDQAVNDMREDVTKMRQAAAQVSGLLSDSWTHVLASSEQRQHVLVHASVMYLLHVHIAWYKTVRQMQLCTICNVR